jgi:acetylornithine/LysW-gamma-L-lysine aminotransferase
MLNTLVNYNTLEQAHTSGAYLKRDVQLVRGEGAYVWDADGNRYIDCVAGQGSANLGHCHLAVVAAIQQQAAELITCTEAFYNPVRARYQAELCRAADMPRVFLCNSGAEAIEGALKIARLKTGRTGIIAAMRGFHGRTMGALSATWEKAYREPFQPLIPGVVHVPYNNVDRLQEALNDTIAAVILEPVQGEGGVHPAQDGYLQAVQELCRANGSLLILDEIQTGFGRTGYLFAHEYDGVQPDLMCLSKSIAGGLPMGAVLMGEQVGELPPASHGSTFGGNPLACAAGLAVLEVLNRQDAKNAEKDLFRDAKGQSSREIDLIARARKLGEQIMAHFREHLPEEAVREVRGRGLMIGVELRGKVAPVLKLLQARGVLALPAGPSVLRLLPPLVISDDDLWQAAAIIEEVLNDAF